MRPEPPGALISTLDAVRLTPPYDGRGERSG